MKSCTLKTPNKQMAFIEGEGGVISSWSVLTKSGEEMRVLYKGTRRDRTGVPTLFPNYGEGDMYHGFWRETVCHLEQLSENMGHLWMDHTMMSEQAAKIYPYQFRTDVTVELDGKNSLIYTMHVENKDTKEIPITPGLHPYWCVPHAEKKKIQTKGMGTFDASAWDWDISPPDDVFPFSHQARFTISDRIIVIEDISDSSQIQHVVVWSQPLSMPDHDFVCFEPITGGDRAIHTHPILVQPGTSWVMKIRFSCIL